MATTSLGQLTLDLVARIGAFTSPLDQAERHSRQRMKQIQRNAQEAAAGFTRFATVTAAAGAGLVAFTTSAANGARELRNQASLANTSTQEFQRWSYATSTVGIEQDKLADILKDTNDRVGEFLSTGGGEMKDFFTNIAPLVGVTAEQFRGLSGPQALQLYYESLEKAGLSQQDMTFYMESMADETTALIPLLRNGGAAIKEYGDQADQMGIVLNDVQTEALTDFANDVSRVTTAMSAGAKVAAAELAPALSNLADEAFEVVDAFQKGEYESQIQLLGNLATTAAVAAGAYGTYRGAVMAATVAQGAFYAATVSNPIGALVLVLGTAVGALYSYREELGLTATAAERTANRVDELTNAIDMNSEAAVKGQLVNLTGQMMELERQADEARKSLDELSQTSNDPGPFRQSMVMGEDAAERREYYEALRQAEEGLEANGKAAEKLRKQLEVLRQSGVDPVERSFRAITPASTSAEKALEKALSGYESLRAEFDAVGAAEAEYAKQVKELDTLLAAGKITQEQYGDATAYLREELAQTKQTATGMTSELQALLDQLDPVSASSRQYADDLALLTRNGQLTTETLERLKETYESTQSASEAYGEGFGAEIGSRGAVGAPTDPDQKSQWDEWLESAENAFTDFDNLNAQVAEDFTSRFGDAIEGMVFDYENLGDAVQGIAEGMARSVVNSLGQMAAQWLAYQAVQLLVGKTTQTSAATMLAANAQAQSAMAGLNAFTSTAAIPIVGPVAAPAAAATAVAATQPMAAAVSALAFSGMAHDGIDSVPADGSWYLQKGERVTTSDTSAKLDRTLDNVQSGMDQTGSERGTGGINIQIINQTGVPVRARAEYITRDDLAVILQEDAKRDGPTRQVLTSNYNMTGRGK